MRIQETAKAVGCTQRAIKFYEEKGLLPSVTRSENGYRDYTDEDVRTLHQIQAYRKLGISIADIKQLLVEKDTALLQSILDKKRTEADMQQREITALEAFINQHDAQALNEAVDFASLSQAMRVQIPGFFGEYIAEHFAPYLQITISTEEQRDAYQRILAFWDNPDIRLPLLFRLNMWFTRNAATRITTKQMDAQLQSMLNPSDEEYERIKTLTMKTVNARRGLLRFLPGEIMKRHMMKKLKDCGYYDIFIEQMKRLSPPYRAYHDALDALNERLRQDLGLYYDSNYQLLMKR